MTAYIRVTKAQLADFYKDVNDSKQKIMAINRKLSALYGREVMSKLKNNAILSMSGLRNYAFFYLTFEHKAQPHEDVTADQLVHSAAWYECGLKVTEDIYNEFTALDEEARKRVIADFLKSLEDVDLPLGTNCLDLDELTPAQARCNNSFGVFRKKSDFSFRAGTEEFERL